MNFSKHRLIVSFLAFTFYVLTFGNTKASKLSSEYDSMYRIGEYENIINSVKEFTPESLTYLDNYRLLLGKCYYHNFQYDSATKYFNEIILSSSADPVVIAEALIFLIQIDVSLRQINDGYTKLGQLEKLPISLSETDLYPLFLFVKGKLVGYKNGTQSLKLLRRSSEIFPSTNPEIIHFLLWYSNVSSGRLSQDLDKTLLRNAIKLGDSLYISNQPIISAIFLQKARSLFGSNKFKASQTVLDTELLPLLRKYRNENWSKFYYAEYYRMKAYYFETFKDQYSASKMYANYIEKIQMVMPANYYRLGEVYESMSKIYESFGRADLSFKYLELSAEVYEHQQNYYNYFRALSSKSEICAAKKEYYSAIDYLDQIIKRIEDDHLIGYSEYIHTTRIIKLKHLYSVGAYDDLLITIDSIYSESNMVLKSYEFLSNFVNDYYLKSLLKTNKKKEYIPLIKELSSKKMVNVRGNLDAYGINIFNTLANRQLKEHNPDSALFFLREVFSQNDNILNVLKSHDNEEMSKSYLKTLSLFADSYNLKGEINKDKKYTYKALEYLKEAIELFAFEENEYISQYDRLRNSSSMKEINDRVFLAYYQLLNNEKNENYQDSTFHISELSKSSALSQAVTNNLIVQNTSISDSLVLEIESLKKQSVYLKNKITKYERDQGLSITDSIDLNQSKTLLISVKETLGNRLNTVKQFHKSFYNSYNSKSGSSINEVQNKLQEDELFLEFFNIKERFFRFTIDRFSATLEELPDISEKEVRAFNDVLQPEYFLENSKEAYINFVHKSQNLFNKLFYKLNSKYLQSFDKLIIVPDGHLNFIPFDLLLSKSPKSKYTNYQNLPYLIQDYNISYDYSAHLFLNNRSNKPATGDLSLLAVAPSYDQLIRDSTQLAALGAYRNSFQELRYNKKEAQLVSQYFDSKLLLGREATESEALKEINEHSILHFAMHALVDNENSERSKLIFVNSKDSMNDGFLHNFELYNTPISCELAVLSACQTGFGNLSSGEGVMSLSRAFTYAGAKSVVMSHWRVNDESSSLIMERFYKSLADGKSKDEALRIAKLEYLKLSQPSSHHPFYWNSFVIIGNTDPLTINQSSYSLFFLILLFAGLLFSLILLFAKTKWQEKV